MSYFRDLGQRIFWLRSSYQSNCESTPLLDLEDENRARMYWRPLKGDIADKRMNLLKMLEYRMEYARENFTAHDARWSFPADYTAVKGRRSPSACSEYLPESPLLG